MGIQDFIGRVSDPYRGTATPNAVHVRGGMFQSPNPGVAAWLDNNPEVGGRLNEVSNAVAALDGMHEGALMAFNKAREAYDESKAAESRAHHDARALGQAVAPDLAKRLLRARQAALATNEESAARLTISTNGFAQSREALNTAVKFVGTLASERSGVVLASPITLPEGAAVGLITEQRKTLVELDVEKSEVESAPIPLEDAIAMVRASVVGEPPRIAIGPRRVDWIAPQQRLNVAPRLGDQPVDIDNTTALLGWLFGDVLADRLEAAVRERYGTAKTYSATERQKALADVGVRRLQAERIEVAAILKAWADGSYVPLRRDTNPIALLGIARVTEGAKEPEGFKGTAYLGEGTR